MSDKTTRRASGDKNASATNVAYSTLREAIIRGEYAPETMLSEAVLGEELGISRTPVRTALARLQDDGLITIYPQRGAMVRGMTAKQTLNLAAAELLIEAGVIRTTPPERLTTLAAKLTSLLEQQRDTLLRGDTAEFVDLCVAFHSAFVKVSDNAILEELYGRLGDRQRYALFSYGDALLERGDEIITEHTELVARLTAHDTEGFTQTLRRHLSETYHHEM